jgi:polysaccharide export outer membrane protein
MQAIHRMKVVVFGLFLCFGMVPHAFSLDLSYKIQPTDVLAITVHEQPDLTVKTRVPSDGNITFPLLGNVGVGGLTVQEAELKLKTLLEKNYLVNAQVLIFIEEYHPRQVSVLGEVKKPGKYSMAEEKDLSLLQAIAMAEGFTKDADTTRIKIMRMENGEQKTVRINAKEIMVQDKMDVVLRPDDVIVVAESIF